MIGEASDLLLALFILDMFIRLAPAKVVNEHIERLNLKARFPLRG